MRIIILLIVSAVILNSAAPCKVSVVGTGLSGVYAAYRLSTAVDSEYKPNEICLFEATSVMGGRLLPVLGPQGQTIELGIDHYSPSTMPLFNELVEFLGLDSASICSNRKAVEKRDVPFFRDENGTHEKLTNNPRATYVETVTEQSKIVEVTNANTEQVSPRPANTEQVSPRPANTVQASPRPANTVQASPRPIIISEQETKEEHSTNVEATNTEQPPATNNTTQKSAWKKREKCINTEFWFIRGKLYSNFTRNETAFNNRKTLEKIRNLPRTAFSQVYGGIVTADQLDAISSENDTITRWEKISQIISTIKNQVVLFQGVPTFQLNLRQILLLSSDNSEEDLVASIQLSKFHHRARHLMEMNFELFTIQYLISLAAEEGDQRTITGPAGLRTMIDSMVKKMDDLGVQIYLNSKLQEFRTLEDGQYTLLKFENINRIVPTSRLLLAINKNNLMRMSSSSLTHISLEAAEILGNLKSQKLVKGVVFYEDAWWRKYNLTGDSFTDTVMNRLRYNSSSNCNEGEKCPGFIEFQIWGNSFKDLPLVTFNPIGIANVLQYYMSGQEGMNNTHEVTNNTHEMTNNTREKTNNTHEMTNNTHEMTNNTHGMSNRPARAIDRTTSNQTEGMNKTEGMNQTEGMQNKSSVDLSDEFEKIVELERKASKFILSLLHETILSIHENYPGFDKSNIEEPKSAVVANWANDGLFDYGAFLLPSNIPYKTFVLSMVEPIPGANIHLVNSDFAGTNRKLESSLIQVERTLKELGMKRPDWNTQVFYNTEIE